MRGIKLNGTYDGHCPVGCDLHASPSIIAIVTRSSNTAAQPGEDKKQGANARNNSLGKFPLPLPSNIHSQQQQQCLLWHSRLKYEKKMQFREDLLFASNTKLDV